ncbi:RmuC-domain protein [Pseudomonas sp. GM41(2012)]|uniref:DNA recombination protein RmuC n=1 Tax=Pseudomonas sp. (strain GM41(2012)) TaxID=1144708 RepID=UPI0002704BC8|nr:DNA recombination protein RmuC [Pseudomonas sp. GM41(2012)]EUB73633.1 RmuC-domain protein [Pseudomonas sp. GM41(2012)]
MPQDTIKLACIVAASLAFLLIGYWIGSRLSAAKAAQHNAELQAKALADHQQLQGDLALAQQREQQLNQDINTHQLKSQQLESGIAALTDLEKALTAQVSGLQEKLLAEQTRTVEKATELSVQTQKIEQGTAQLGDQQNQNATLREQLSQALEQVKHLTELKVAYDALDNRFVKAQEVLTTQSELLGQAAEQKQNLEDARTKIEKQDSELRSLQAQLNDLQTTLAHLDTGRAKDQEAAEAKLRLLQENKEQLKQEFQNLATQIFDTKQQTFSEQSRQGLDALLKPFKDQLESFRQRVDQVHTDTVQGQSSMKTELGKLMELNAQITTEASNLTKALKGDKKLQGTWGEQKVELLLEQAGLRKGIEYQREANFKNDDAENNRPDFVIQLPEGKHIIIDSKMSLVAYTEYVSSETDEACAKALAAHVQALKVHITSLSGKKYPELKDMDSPDFVFLFIPVEPAYLVAAEHSPGVFQDAYEKRIAIVTATTLLPVLRVISNLWTIQRQNRSTLLLAQQATRVYDKLRVFVEKMDKLGNQLSTVQKTFADGMNTLSGSHGSLTKTVDKFVDLGVKVVKRLPASATVADDDLDADIEMVTFEEAVNE